MAGKYEEYDAKMISLIHGGCSTFDQLCRRLMEENIKLAGNASEAFRVTDRRLQALRKTGKVTYDRTRQKWHIGGYQ